MDLELPAPANPGRSPLADAALEDAPPLAMVGALKSLLARLRPDVEAAAWVVKELESILARSAEPPPLDSLLPEHETEAMQTAVAAVLYREGGAVRGSDSDDANLASPDDTQRLDWLLPNLHPANFGMDYDKELYDTDSNRAWRDAIDRDLTGVKVVSTTSGDKGVPGLGPWTTEADLVYRLYDSPHGRCNHDEFTVGMAGGSRGAKARAERALALAELLRREPL